MPEAAVLTERREGLAVIRMNRPANRNALDAQLQAGLAEAIEHVRLDETVKAVVLAGGPDCFCAGGDLRGLSAASTAGEDIFAARKRIGEMHRWFLDLLDLEKPVVAAVSGPAFGAGLSLALACDFIFAAQGATFCSVFARVGYVPDLAQMYLLPRQVGIGAAKDMVFTGRVVSAREGHSMGLVRLVADAGVDVEVLAADYAMKFCGAPTAALGLAKAIMNRSYESQREAVVQSELMI